MNEQPEARSRARERRTPLQMALHNAGNCLDLLGFEIASYGEGQGAPQPVLDAWDHALDLAQEVSELVDAE